MYYVGLYDVIVKVNTWGNLVDGVGQAGENELQYFRPVTVVEGTSLGCLSEAHTRSPDMLAAVHRV